ncbi:hypothetical protein DFP74_1064 [Nocardiopsis sp. Huas11]|uniref:hypothetical protein n=1 Tax=Nocardiopsis sp. Huas11 TaxID=2183912 RepID=UPI000EB448FB|nr:hypothetical protein [Nocardiopsis sp. Huas11]RKS05465.1 hypothetical protein DFP74_1064 [Nocardiopsis sp. Huas11]
MGQFSPAFLRSALDCLKALLTPARGRHSVAGRRRRSTRVRRYAPLPDPALARAATRPAPRLAAPPAPIPAEEVALVRGYYRAFETERDLARVQAQARARLDQWTARPPVGDLLAPVPRPRRAEAVAV